MGPWERHEKTLKVESSLSNGATAQLWLFTQRLLGISCFAGQQSYHERHS